MVSKHLKLYFMISVVYTLLLDTEETKTILNNSLYITMSICILFFHGIQMQ